MQRQYSGWKQTCFVFVVVVLYKKWIDKGVCFIKNILNENGTLMLFKRFKEIYRINTDYITYFGCVQAIKSYIHKTGLTVESNSSTDLTKTLKIIYSQLKGSRLYYEILTQGKDKPKCCEKCEARLNTDIDWSRNFKKMQNQEIKIKWFQIRPVHRILATNIVLMHMGIENDINCSFCRRERDSINHIFWRCVYVKSFGEHFQTTLNTWSSNARTITLNYFF